MCSVLPHRLHAVFPLLCACPPRKPCRVEIYAWTKFMHTHLREAVPTHHRVLHSCSTRARSAACYHPPRRPALPHGGATLTCKTPALPSSTQQAAFTTCPWSCCWASVLRLSPTWSTVRSTPAPLRLTSWTIQPAACCKRCVGGGVLTVLSCGFASRKFVGRVCLQWYLMMLSMQCCVMKCNGMGCCMMECCTIDHKYVF